jgi:histidinol-phosphate aminotransferase
MENKFDLSRLVRKNILTLKPYSSARDEFAGKEGIFLDANENPFGVYNRYPDPNQYELKSELAQINGLEIENIFVGNGSDEAIDLAFRIFCIPSHDQVIVCPPTYGMYEVSAGINDVDVIKIPLDDDFQLDSDAILSTSAKIIFICSPNNPTGNNINHIENIIEHFKGIVFVDEAYIDFSKNESLISKINKYPNLIVSQTFSKARGLAAARVGMVYASKEIVSLFQKTKPPYNVSLLNQSAALLALKNRDEFRKNIEILIAERARMFDRLGKLSIVKKVYPSDANFLLIKLDHPTEVYNQLTSRRIVVRNRHKVIDGCLRITIGSTEENNLLMTELNNIDK